MRSHLRIAVRGSPKNFPPKTTLVRFQETWTTLENQYAVPQKKLTYTYELLIHFFTVWYIRCGLILPEVNFVFSFNFVYTKLYLR